MIFWNLQISLSTTAPGLNQHGCGGVLVLIACLPSCEGDFWPHVALLRPTDPFCFVFQTQAYCLRDSFCSCQAFARKVSRRFCSLSLTWASWTLTCGQGSAEPSSSRGISALPIVCSISWGRLFNTLGMPCPLGAAGSSYLGMACG